MSLTVRIDEATHTALKRLAVARRASLQETLAAAVHALRRHDFFESFAKELAARSPEEEAEDQVELEAWSDTLRDGLEDD